MALGPGQSSYRDGVGSTSASGVLLCKTQRRTSRRGGLQLTVQAGERRRKELGEIEWEEPRATVTLGERLLLYSGGAIQEEHRS